MSIKYDSIWCCLCYFFSAPNFHFQLQTKRGKNLKQKTCTFPSEWPVCDLGHTHIAKHNFNEIIRSFFSFSFEHQAEGHVIEETSEEKKQSYGKVRLQVWKLNYFGELGGCAKGFGVWKKAFSYLRKNELKKIDWQKFCRMILSHHRFQFFPISLSLSTCHYAKLKRFLIEFMMRRTHFMWQVNT